MGMYIREESLINEIFVSSSYISWMIRSKSNIILPGRGMNMGSGWETKRSRQPNHTDWVIVKLASVGRLTNFKIDTNFYKGNNPKYAGVHGCYSLLASICLYTTLHVRTTVKPLGIYRIFQSRMPNGLLFSNRSRYTHIKNTTFHRIVTIVSGSSVHRLAHHGKPYQQYSQSTTRENTRYLTSSLPYIQMVE